MVGQDAHPLNFGRVIQDPNPRGGDGHAIPCRQDMHAGVVESIDFQRLVDALFLDEDGSAEGEAGGNFIVRSDKSYIQVASSVR